MNKCIGKPYRMDVLSSLRLYGRYCINCNTYHNVGKIPSYIPKEQYEKYLDEIIKREDHIFDKYTCG